MNVEGMTVVNTEYGWTPLKWVSLTRVWCDVCVYVCILCMYVYTYMYVYMYQGINKGVTLWMC